MSEEFSTVKENIDAFRHFAVNRSGRANIDSSWSSRLVYFYLTMYTRTEEYRWQLEQGPLYDKKILDQDYDTLPCIELAELDQVEEAPCAPAAGCMFLKGKHPLPELVSKDNDIMVTDLVGDTAFDYVKWHNFRRKITSRKKAQRTRPYFTLRTIDGETYPYIYNRDFLKAVAMTARFVNPVDVKKFPKCGEVTNELIDCSALDQKFHITDHLRSRVFERTFNTLVSMRNSNNTDDVISDDLDDTASPPKQQ